MFPFDLCFLMFSEGISCEHRKQMGTRFFIYIQLHFLFQIQTAYGYINFQSESCLAVAYSIHSQLLVAQQLLIFKKIMLPSLQINRR